MITLRLCNKSYVVFFRGTSSSSELYAPVRGEDFWVGWHGAGENPKSHGVPRCFPNLNKESQDAFDRVLLKARRHADAASYQGFVDPVYGMLLAVFLEMEKELLFTF